MAVRDIVLLGDPRLYQVCDAVEAEELSELSSAIQDLHDTLLDFRRRHEAGRAIAAPQIGVMKRIVCMNIDQPLVFINPVLSDFSNEMFTLWDDCMSFPELLVKVQRHRSCRMTYRDAEWREQHMQLDGALSELLQHEVDHLDGVLAVQRAVDGQSFALRSQRDLVG